LRILQVHSQFLPSLGGIQIVMYNIAKLLAKRGHKVTIFSSNLVGDRAYSLPREEVVDLIHVNRFKVLPPKLLRKFVFAPSVIQALYSIETDLFHVFSYLPTFMTNTACLISKRRRIPLIITPVYHPSRTQLYTNVVGKLVKVLYDDLIGLKLLRKADCVIALTEAEARYYRERGINNICVVPAGVDLREHACEDKGLEAFERKYDLSKNRILLFVGRLEERKGIHYLIKSMPIILRENPKAKVLVVGKDWSCRGQLENLSKRLNIQNNVVFTGPINSTQLLCAYELSDIVVIPSLYEAFGLVVVEAWAHKKPVVVSGTIGLAETISAEKAGIVVNLSDPEALAKAVAKLLSDKRLSKSMGTRGFQVVKKEFTWEKIVDKLEEVYRSVAEKGVSR
jgi:glycosyltransferase involved in cell wall biosynthesis